VLVAINLAMLVGLLVPALRRQRWFDAVPLVAALTLVAQVVFEGFRPIMIPSIW
jgi:hypothetical protein